MDGVRALLAAEIAFGIAVTAGGAGHRVGLGLVVIGGGPPGPPGPSSGGAASAFGWKLFIEAQALIQRAVDREVLARQQRRHFPMGEDSGEEFARHLGAQQPSIAEQGP
jgi:hypothetical protein